MFPRNRREHGRKCGRRQRRFDRGWPPAGNPCNRDLWVNDTYPNAVNEMTLMLYLQPTNRRLDLLRLKTQPGLKETGWRCDFHPAGIQADKKFVLIPHTWADVNCVCWACAMTSAGWRPENWRRGQIHSYYIVPQLRLTKIKTMLKVHPRFAYFQTAATRQGFASFVGL